MRHFPSVLGNLEAVKQVMHFQAQGGGVRKDRTNKPSRVEGE